MKKACALIVSLLTAAMVLCGCDPSGLLTEDETQELYEELCGDFSDASVWDMDIEIWNDMLKNNDGQGCIFPLGIKKGGHSRYAKTNSIVYCNDMCFDAYWMH